jgi:hypothetical protein
MFLAFLRRRHFPGRVDGREQIVVQIDQRAMLPITAGIAIVGLDEKTGVSVGSPLICDLSGQRRAAAMHTQDYDPSPRTILVCWH